MVDTTTYIHEHVCTWYVQVCTLVNMYIHVHECTEIHKYAYSTYSVQTHMYSFDLSWQVGRIPDEPIETHTYQQTNSPHAHCLTGPLSGPTPHATSVCERIFFLFCLTIKRKEVASFQIANGGERRRVMRVGAR